MGLCLIAESSPLINLAATLYVILKVALGLGAVIFVHELGHFLVAKACGVKCEKFYVGFDVPIKIFGVSLPRVLWKQQWGETEYGVGIIPLGGYVKMLGQDDNPTNYEAEAERTRIRKNATVDAANAASEPVGDTAAGDASPAATDTAASETVAGTQTVQGSLGAGPDATDDPYSGETAGAPGQAGESEDEVFELDPRSFPAKNVLQRMLIISAGVVMNLIFAVIFATIAYFMGVPYTPCVIGSTVPGSPAWVAALEPGSRIIQIGRNGSESQHLRFSMDLLQNIAITGGNEDIELLLQDREGNKKWVKLRPVLRKVGREKYASIGVTVAASTKLAGTKDKPPVIPHLPAGQAEDTFESGDRIVAIEVDGSRREVPDYFRLREIMARHVDDEVTFIVERKAAGAADSQDSDPIPTVTARVTIAANPMRRVGLIMEMGPISAIQEGSPAEQAGFEVGDAITTINGQPVSDPIVIPHMLRRLVGEEVRIGVVRDKQSIDLTVTPTPPTMQLAYFRDTPMAVQTIGVTYPVLNRVKSVEADSPAAAAGMKKGDELLEASFVPANKEQLRVETKELKLNDDPIKLGEERNWLPVLQRLQISLYDTKLKLKFKRGDKEKTSEMLPVASDEWHVASRGFILTAEPETHTAKSLGEACALGCRNTKESLLHVVKFLRKLVTGQISPKNLGGPGTILMVAGSEAQQGISRLLMFLTLLSANLAIINFLPIPVLDGGHMVFLFYEAIVGKPVNEVWAMRLTVAGLVFILGLMAFVLSLDIYRFAQMWV